MISKRISELQKLCKKRGQNPMVTHFEKDYNYAALNIYNDLNHVQKLQKSMAYALTNMDVFAYEGDMIGGRIYYTREEPVILKSEELDYILPVYNKLRDMIANFDEVTDNQLITMLFNGDYLSCNGHIAWRYDYILSLGVDRLKEKYIKALENPKDETAKEFYEGVITLLDALLAYNDKHIEVYENLGNFELADIMRNVPRHPAKTFKEAVQAFYMQYIVVMRENPFGGNSPGRLDYFLWPYLKKDLEIGIITLEEAKEIIDELFLRIDERIYDIDVWTETVVVGGTNEDGSSSDNPLTYIMVESITDLNIIHPALYIRMPKDPSEKMLQLAAKYLMNGSNRAQIINDGAIIDALVKSSVEYKDAVHYVCGGCMEIGVQGKNSDFLFGGWQNTAKMLELLISGGTCLLTGKKINDFDFNKSLSLYDDFESFYSDYLKVVKKYVHLSFYIYELYNKLAEVNRPSYLMSSMVDNCLEKGRNLNAGGAKYHNYGSTPIAIPDTIDCLYAIKYAVFDKGICTKEEMLDALTNNFKGYEKLQSKLKAIPKYGVDNDEVDLLGRRLVSDICDIYNSFETRFGGVAKPIILTFLYAPIATSILGARADGRGANFNIAQGLTPNTNSMTAGITAGINSCCKLPFDKLSGGASSMWDIDATWVKEEVLISILKTFLDKNGQIFQGNVISVDDLIKAQKNPENYHHLIVRVGGYSSRFNNLSVEVQNEIISRMRNNC